ncbi:hypothetical protein MLD38_030552 [Melastoma candidum]|uniref:Uncharacterized protein n=1 Tax=Melastoma candidum TaxID=119954 RepID=A0ACB9MNW8_9MYRT|nr:hypothetical protein MLD38_030552 [Melastoma candidum]
MENCRKWKFQGNEGLTTASSITIRGVRNMLMDNLNQDDPRVVVPLGHGDPSAFPSFRTTSVAEDGVVHALRSGQFNCYSSTVGILPARRAVAEYLSRDLPYKLSPDDIFMTIGCTQAIEVVLTVLAQPGANILLPRPGYPFYDARASHSCLEVRYFDLLPEKGWEVDLKAVEDLADENTVAMVIINPGNPCGNVFSYSHLKQVAETARKVGIMVIADEVYGHQIVESIKGYLNISSDPPTFIQAGVPHILSRTDDEFFSRIICVLREAADICDAKLKEIPCINCRNKPEGSMFVMAKLDLSLLDGIKNDIDFCLRLAKEESVIVLPGVAVGLKDWLRITFAVEPSSLKDGLSRIKAFCKRHAKR